MEDGRKESPLLGESINKHQAPTYEKLGRMGRLEEANHPRIGRSLLREKKL